MISYSSLLKMKYTISTINIINAIFKIRLSKISIIEKKNCGWVFFAIIIIKLAILK